MTTGAHRAERRHLVIHAHFYQPPREDPDLDEVEAEVSAAPFHDWNERIERECYRAVVAARVHGADGRIAGIVNTLEWISFNVGPTLFEWLVRHAPDTARRMVAADRASVARLGHGNAIAHPYHHVILPLASRRDKVTEVRWGMMDFRRRFGREPEGMWLPETAVDDETLDVLAQEGVRFTILAPHQVVGAAPNGHAGRYVTANGREIALFPYHGDISHGIAFGGLVRNADHWLEALWAVKASRRRTPVATDVATQEPTHPLLVSAATDGETYGHHHKFAELALARVLERSRVKGGHIDNFASFLAHHPARQDVSIVAPSSWSCSHGIERWRADCGCRMDGQAAPSQGWRAPLREGLVTAAAALHQRFVDEGRRFFDDPWAVRDAYGAVVGSSTVGARQEFVRVHSRARPDDEQVAQAVALLEMERDALRMFTSCAWFFDDIGGLEPRQVMRYAQRALRSSGLQSSLEPTLLATLGAAPSNDPGIGTGADVYRQVATRLPSAVRVAAALRALADLGLAERDPLVGETQPRIGDRFDAVVRREVISLVDWVHFTMRQYQVRLIERSSADLAYEVIQLNSPGGPPTVVRLADFPESVRIQVRRALRDALLAQCLTATELADLAAGAASLKALASGALSRAVRAADPGAPDTLTAVEVHLDLFEQLETAIPFDAQTAFWDRWSSGSPSQRVALQGIARRLGFTGD